MLIQRIIEINRNTLKEFIERVNEMEIGEYTISTLSYRGGVSVGLYLTIFRPHDCKVMSVPKYISLPEGLDVFMPNGGLMEFGKEIYGELVKYVVKNSDIAHRCDNWNAEPLHELVAHIYKL